MRWRMSPCQTDWRSRLQWRSWGRAGKHCRCQQRRRWKVSLLSTLCLSYDTRYVQGQHWGILIWHCFLKALLLQKTLPSAHDRSHVLHGNCDLVTFNCNPQDLFNVFHGCLQYGLPRVGKKKLDLSGFGRLMPHNQREGRVEHDWSKSLE